MIVGSTKEDLSKEKRVSITPESANNIIKLGLKISIEKDYASHLGINDKEYEKAGVQIRQNGKTVIEEADLLVKVNCLSDNEISDLKKKLS